MASQAVEIADRPKLIGRPSSFDPAQATEIIERMSGGEPLASICKDRHMPSFPTVLRWEDDFPEFRELSLRARLYGTHAIADDCLRIADDMGIDANHKRIMVETRIRLIGKWNRKVYGESVQVDTNLQISVRTALDAAQARVIDGTATRITTSSAEPTPDDDL